MQQGDHSIGNNLIKRHNSSTLTVLSTKIELTDTSHQLPTIWTQDDLVADKMKPTTTSSNTKDDKGKVLD